VDSARLAHADRRDALLDAAVEFVAAGHIDDISMESVAERAGVSRALVYKHFANRHDLLAAVYQRESALLHDELAADVAAASSVEEMFRALVHGALRAQASRGATFAALRGARMRTTASRAEQRQRDRTTLRYFATQAVRQFGLDEPHARAGVAIMLGAIETVLAQWRARPTPQHAALLEDAYVALVVGGLHELARQR